MIFGFGECLGAINAIIVLPVAHHLLRLFFSTESTQGNQVDREQLSVDVLVNSMYRLTAEVFQFSSALLQLIALFNPNAIKLAVTH